MKVEVVDINGKKTGKQIELPESVFGIKPNGHAIYLDVKQYLANQRQGTHKAKERGEIKGSTRKLKRQKGTGTARAGSIKNPLFKGGGRVFGPRPRNYSMKINKKVKRLARKSALSIAASKDKILIVESFKLDQPRTKDFVQILKSLDLEDKKTLFVLDEINKNVYLSSRNLQKVKVVTNTSINTYNILDANKVVFFDSAVEGIAATLDV